VKGKLANAVGSQYPSHYLGTCCIQHYYRWCAHLGWTDARVFLNSPKDEIWFLRVCYHVSDAVYNVRQQSNINHVHLCTQQKISVKPYHPSPHSFNSAHGQSLTLHRDIYKDSHQVPVEERAAAASTTKALLTSALNAVTGHPHAPTRNHRYPPNRRQCRP